MRKLEEPTNESVLIGPEIIQRKHPKPKRNYPQVGEPSLLVNNDDTMPLESEKTFSAQKILTYVLAVLTIAAVIVLLFSMLGAAVFLLPLLGGAFAK